MLIENETHHDVVYATEAGGGGSGGAGLERLRNEMKNGLGSLAAAGKHDCVSGRCFGRLGRGEDHEPPPTAQRGLWDLAVLVLDPAGEVPLAKSMLHPRDHVRVVPSGSGYELQTNRR